MTDLSVWAPAAASVAVQTAGDRQAMDRHDGGWWRVDVPSLAHGDDYAFLLDDEATALPDPRSRWQPSGVHGPSRVYDQGRFDWTDHAWRGVALPGALFYELHVGTFTPDGTLDASTDTQNVFLCRWSSDARLWIRAPLTFVPTVV